MEFKIFEGATMQEAYDKLLTTGFMPASLRVIWQLRKEGKIPMRWYDTGTVYIDGVIRKGKMSEFKNLKSFYDKGGRVVCLDLGYSGVLGNGDIYYNSRPVGIQK